MQNATVLSLLRIPYDRERERERGRERGRDLEKKREKEMEREGRLCLSFRMINFLNLNYDFDNIKAIASFIKRYLRLY